MSYSSNCYCNYNYISNPTASVICHTENVDVTTVCCEAPCLFHGLIIMLPVYRSCKCLLNLIHISYTDVAKNVARCRDGEVHIQRALKLANVDWVVWMLWHPPPCSYTFSTSWFLHAATWSGAPSLQFYWFLWKTFLLPCLYNYCRAAWAQRAKQG